MSPADSSACGRRPARAALAVAALAVVLAAAPVVAAPPLGRIVGSVSNANGVLLAGAEVALRGPLERTALSDAAGAFVFEGLSDGAYDVRATLAGYATARKTLRLVNGHAPGVSLVLQVVAFDSVMVTATKDGERDAQSVAMSLSVLSAAELEALRATSVEDLAGRAPGVTFSQNTGFAQLTIRGIGTNAVFTGSDPSSTVYLDGVYLARPAMVLTEFLDLERIEVVAGPLGPLYGRNALGGVVNVITAAPTNELQAQARLGVGELGARRVSGRVAGPILEGRLMGSVAFLRGVRQGFVRDLEHPAHSLGGEDMTAGRVKLQVMLGPRTDLLLAFDVTLQDPIPLFYSKVLAVKPGFTVDNPEDPREVRASTLATSRNLHTVRAPASRRGCRADHADQPAGLPRPGLRPPDRQRHHGARAHRHRAPRDPAPVVERGHRLLGLDGCGMDRRLVPVRGRRSPAFARAPGRARNRERVRVESRVALGSPVRPGDGRARPHLHATAGLRYTRERKTVENSGGLYPEAEPGTPFPTRPTFRDALSNDAWSPRLALDARLGDALVYVAATRGFKSGGFNISSREPGHAFAPEWAWSYEAGLKSTLAGGRARLNGAIFYTDYTNLQVLTTIRPGIAEVTNAAEATIRGAELEVTWQLGPGLQVGGHVAWLDARYDQYLAVGVNSVTSDVAGHFLSNSPEWSGRGFIHWSLAAGRVGTVSLRADARFQSTVYFTPSNEPLQRQRPYSLLDASLRLGRDHLSIAAYARNLTGVDYVTGTFGAALPAIGGRPGEPRLLGLELTLAR